MSTDVKKYQVVGDAGCTTETLLYDDNSSAEAIRWAKAYCRYDLGGYESVTVLYYKDDGEAVDLWRLNDDD